jgi:uncharacterized membrane protein YdbT with pleckstrin-like domain
VVVLRFRRHGRHLLFPVLMMCVIASVSGFWVGGLPEVWMNIAAAGLVILLTLLLGILPVLGWLAHRTTVTTRRVIVRQGLFVRRRAEVGLSRVREVRSRRNLLQRLFGSGDIDLMFGTEKVTLADSPGVVVAVDALQELLERNYEQSVPAAPFSVE